MRLILLYLIFLVFSISIKPTFAEIKIQDSIITIYPSNNAILDSIYFTFVWNKFQNHPGYAFEIATDSLFCWHQIMGGIRDTSLTLTDESAGALGIGKGQKYYWRVVSGGNGSGYLKPVRSPIHCFTILPDDERQSVIYQPNSIVDSTNIIIRWSSAKDITKYVLTVKGFQFKLDTLVSDTVCVIPYLRKGTYTTFVNSVYSDSNLFRSATSRFLVGKQLNKAPNLLYPPDSAKYIKPNCTFSWKPNINIPPNKHWISVYKEEGDLKASTAPIVDTAIEGDSFCTIELEPNTRYYWRVVASSGGEYTHPSDLYSGYYVFTTGAGAGIYPPTSAPTFSVYPNPLQERGVISLCLTESRQIELNMISVTGHVLKNVYAGQLDKGCHDIPISTVSLSNGYFYLQLKNDGQVRQTSFIKF